MGCKHEHLKCTGNVLTCMDCGALLPLELLEWPRADKPEAPAKPAPTCPQGPQTPQKRTSPSSAGKQKLIKQ